MCFVVVVVIVSIPNKVPQLPWMEWSGLTLKKTDFENLCCGNGWHHTKKIRQNSGVEQCSPIHRCCCCPQTTQKVVPEGYHRREKIVTITSSFCKCISVHAKRLRFLVAAQVWKHFPCLNIIMPTHNTIAEILILKVIIFCVYYYLMKMFLICNTINHDGPWRNDC